MADAVKKSETVKSNHKGEVACIMLFREKILGQNFL